MQDDNDVKIKRRWEMDPFRKNSPAIVDPERVCDDFCKAFCDAFCREFTEEFFADNFVSVSGRDGFEEGGEESDGEQGVVGENDNREGFDFGRDRERLLEAFRERCCKTCQKVCRRIYWEVINKGPLA